MILHADFIAGSSVKHIHQIEMLVAISAFESANLLFAHLLFVSLGEPVQRPAILINTFKEFCFCLSRYFRFYCKDFISNVYYILPFNASGLVYSCFE